MTMPPCRVTTSWDDGHPLDLRLADLLQSHGVRGTFYVPGECGRRVMSSTQTRELARAFDIGAHTLTHPRLTGLPPREAAAEIRYSKEFIEQTTGRPCSVFAPPGGFFNADHVAAAALAGFAGFRTTELMSLAAPRKHGPMALLPTTLQIFEHPAASFVKKDRKSVV